MKSWINTNPGRLGLFAWAGLLLTSLTPAPVHADSTEDIINLLKAKDIITAEEADQILNRHKAQAAEEAQVRPTSGGRPVTIVMPKGQKYPKATIDPVSKDIKEEVARQVKQELKEQVEKEVKREAAETAALDWTKRIRFGGDLRLRYSEDYFDENNALPFSPADPTQLLNRNIDREKLQYRARLYAKAQVNDDAEVGFRLTTGNTSSPISTNDTLGDYMNKDTVTFDQAYLKYSPINDSTARFSKLDLWGGRMPNPFFSTDLVWDSDVNFEGVAANAEISIIPQLKTFFILGAFPLQEVDLSKDDKWLYGGQLGLQYTTSKKVSYTLAMAYYDYQNIQGRRNPYSIGGEGPYDYTAPEFQQTGNVLFNINQFNTGSTLFALASDYNELNLTAQIDVGVFDPIHVILVADYVKNLGFDSTEVNELTGENVPEDVAGYQFSVTVGYPKLDKLWDWQASLAYKYLEADAVLDAFTDSDFHLGGTNAKGWILGGQLGLGKNMWLSARWLSSDVITGPPIAVDTVQFDINTRF